MRKAIMTGLSILTGLVFVTAAFPYVTHSGVFSLDDLAVKIQNWLKQDKPEQLASDNNMKTHPWLSLRSIQLFEHSTGISLPPDVKQQIVLGSIEEDYDILGTSTVGDYSHMQSNQPLSTWQWDIQQVVTGDVNRSENHFMNSDDDLDGLTSGAPFVNTARNVSALKWANDDPRNLTNFVMAKTEGNTLKGWRYLGHILHLLEDMSVPAHARNDAHIIYENYEGYMAAKVPAELFLLAGDDAAMRPWEPSNTDIAPFFRQLSGYTRTNYFSEHTVFMNNYYGIALPVATVSREDNHYFYGTNGKKIANKGLLFWAVYSSATSSSNPRPLGETNYDLVKTWARIDQSVAEDMFSDLGPRAIQYCAGLIKLFYDLVTPRSVQNTR
ncbi:MAG: hypothetical protein M1497_10000 [Nitrospirae bacterium]|nr:hypothetical protein [Nitrospirota bacterium]